MRTTPLHFSLPELLGDQWPTYIKTVFLEEVKRLYGEGALTPLEIARVEQLVRQKGLKVLAPQLRSIDGTSLNGSDASGFIARADLPLTDTVSLTHIVKRAFREDVEQAAENQRKAANRVGENDSIFVPRVAFTNPLENLIITPYIEGVPLQQTVRAATTEERKSHLKTAIVRYATLFSALNKEGSLFPEMPLSFQDFFVEHFLEGATDSTLAKQFKEQIGSKLDEACRWNIHGDLHGQNILRNGRDTYIDWARASSNGFPEYDIGMLLGRLEPDIEQEEELARFAQSTIAGEIFSWERYQQFMITYDLQSTAKLLRRMKKESSQRTAVAAAHHYQRVKERLARGVERNIISEDLGTELLAALERLPGSEECHSSHDPSPEWLYPSAFLTPERRNKPLTTQDEGDPISSLSQVIRREGKKKIWKQRVRTGVLALGAVAILGLSTFANYQSTTHQRENAEREAQQEQQFNRSSYQSQFAWTFEQLAYDVLDGDINESNGRIYFSTSDPLVTTVAKEYGLPLPIIQRIFEVNKTFAGVNWSARRDIQNMRGINLFDPITAYNTHERNPERNFRIGAARLAHLLTETDGNLEEALALFYTPTDPAFHNTTDYRNDPEEKEVWNSIRSLTYSALEGMNFAMDGGIQSQWLREAPENFLMPEPPTLQCISCQERGITTYSPLDNWRAF